MTISPEMSPEESLANLLTDYAFAIRGLSPATSSTLSKAIVSNSILFRIDALCNERPGLRGIAAKYIEFWKIGGPEILVTLG